MYILELGIKIMFKSMCTFACKLDLRIDQSFEVISRQYPTLKQGFR